jgi:hypothetical protein
MMERFFGERIEVKKEPMSPDPVSFKWRGEVHDVREILDMLCLRAAGNGICGDTAATM